MENSKANHISRRRAMNFILILGVVSLFGDITYEGARSIIGPYLSILGASAAIVGFVSGLGEFIGYAVRLASGYIADRTKKYWMITWIGYLVNLLAVPLLAVAGRWEIAALLIILERLGKGIRNPSRDTMLSYATKEVGRGWGFGVHEAMDQIGAILGPMVVSLVLFLKLGYREGFAVLAIPAFLSLAALFVARINFPRPQELEAEKEDFNQLPKLSNVFWLYNAFIFFSVLGFAAFSLISFHMKKFNIVPDAQIPVFFAIAMAVDAFFALLAGKLYDRIGLKFLLIAPLLTIPIPLLSFSYSYWGILLGMILWGAGMGIQESIMRAAIADITMISKRGIGYGVFNTSYGLALLMGSSLMGILYDISLTFIVLFTIVSELVSLPFFFLILKKIKSART
jgi:MFS family permease